MINISDTAKNLIRGISLQFCIILASGLIIILWVYPFEKPLAFISGLILGSIWSIIKVILMERGITHSIDFGSGGASLNMVFQFFIRFLLTSVLLVIGAINPWIGFFGITLGLIILQTSAFGVKLFTKGKLLN